MEISSAEDGSWWHQSRLVHGGISPGWVVVASVQGGSFWHQSRVCRFGISPGYVVVASVDGGRGGISPGWVRDDHNACFVNIVRFHYYACAR